MTPTLTERDTRPERAEAAYLHLASFQRDQHVLVIGPTYLQVATIATPLGEAGDSGRIEFTHLTIDEGGGVRARVGVLALLAGRCTITSDTAARGECLWFDHPTWVTRYQAA